MDNDEPRTKWKHGSAQSGNFKFPASWEEGCAERGVVEIESHYLSSRPSAARGEISENAEISRLARNDKRTE